MNQQFWGGGPAKFARCALYLRHSTQVQRQPVLRPRSCHELAMSGIGKSLMSTSTRMRPYPAHGGQAELAWKACTTALNTRHNAAKCCKRGRTSSMACSEIRVAFRGAITNLMALEGPKATEPRERMDPQWQKSRGSLPANRAGTGDALPHLCPSARNLPPKFRFRAPTTRNPQN